MRVLAADTFNAYAKLKPRRKGFLLAFRAIAEAARWQRLKDVEAQFVQVAILMPPDRVAFDFPEEDVRIEMRLNCALNLARVSNIGPSTRKKERQT